MTKNVMEADWNRRQAIQEHYRIRQNIGRRTREIHAAGGVSWENAEKQEEEYKNGELELRPLVQRGLADKPRMMQTTELP